MYHRGVRRAQKARRKAPLLRFYAEAIAFDQIIEQQYYGPNSGRKPKYKDDAARHSAYKKKLRFWLRNEGKAHKVDTFIPRLNSYRHAWDWDGHRTHQTRRDREACAHHFKIWQKDYLNPQIGDGPYGDPTGMEEPICNGAETTRG